MSAIGVAPAFVNHLDWIDIQIEAARTSLLLADHQACTLQNGEVIHHRDPADIEIRREGADRLARLCAEQIKNGAACFMGERVEDLIHIFISDHVIT